jgi:PAS domain-containing protein
MAIEQSLPRRGLGDELVLEAVLRHAPVGVVVLDGDLRIERWSRVAESDGPLGPGAPGRPLFEAWPGIPDDVVLALRRVACGRASQVDMRSESPDWRADRMVISAVTDDLGAVERIVWIWSDIR